MLQEETQKVIAESLAEEHTKAIVEPRLIRVHSFLYIVVDTDGEPLDVEPVTETLDIEGVDPVPLGHQIRDWLASLSAGLDEAIAADMEEQQAKEGQ